MPVPQQSIFTGQMLLLMPNQQWESTEGKFNGWKTSIKVMCVCFVKAMLSVTRDVASDSTLDSDDCFALCVMSHGQIRSVRTTDGDSVRCECVFGSDGIVVPTTTLLAPFSNEKCPSLKGKPKIVIFQACRGGICCVC